MTTPPDFRPDRKSSGVSLCFKLPDDGPAVLFDDDAGVCNQS
jgi:hypothetical protein